MSTTDRFDSRVSVAADCLVAEYGVDGAIDELAQRRKRRDGDLGRINEALAYLKRRANVGGESA